MAHQESFSAPNSRHWRDSRLVLCVVAKWAEKTTMFSAKDGQIEALVAANAGGHMRNCVAIQVHELQRPAAL